MREASQVGRAVERYGDLVRRICFLYLKNDSDAQDAFQEVFLKYMLHKGVFQSDEHEKAWIVRVSINRCKDTLRGFVRRRSVPLEQAEHLYSHLPQEHHDIYQAVLALPEKYRSIVYLFYYEGYSAVEIAKILGHKENTVYTWLARARGMLKDWLGGEAFDG